jgi:hypothetical protein
MDSSGLFPFHAQKISGPAAHLRTVFAAKILFGDFPMAMPASIGTDRVFDLPLLPRRPLCPDGLQGVFNDQGGRMVRRFPLRASEAHGSPQGISSGALVFEVGEMEGQQESLDRFDGTLASLTT